jgi:hypothetical protein
VPDQELSLPDLVATGLANRPELAANSALVCEAVNRLRREERAPWLPSIILGVSYGAFGAGTGSAITNGGDRFDFDGVAWWELRNLGLGERAAQTMHAQPASAHAEIETMDLVAREVVESHACSSPTAADHVRRAGHHRARQSYHRNLERIQNAQGLPIEVLQAIQRLTQHNATTRAVDYNTAQFRLQRVLGWLDPRYSRTKVALDGLGGGALFAKRRESAELLAILRAMESTSIT